MAANEYKVKVGVEFNAQMSNINSQIDQLKDKITKLGSATGDKSLAAGLNKDIQEITTRLNGLRDMTITPANFNRFQAELQAVNGLIQKVQSSLNNVDVSNILQKIEEQKTKQTELNKEIEVQNKLIDDLNNTDNRTDEQNKQLDEAIQKRKQLTQQVNGHKGAQTKLEKQLAATGLTQEEITRLLEAYGRAMQEAEKDGQKFKQGQEELANSKLADTIKNQVNAYIGLGAIYRYTKKYIQDLVRTYKEFDQSLVAIAAVTGQTRDEMWANIGVYNKMAQSLGVTTQEVINASKLYYQQGLTTTSVLKLTEETVKLATIAELDSADATEYLTTAMNGFKLSAEESTRVTDVWANLAAKTASDVDELAIAISKVASLAENAGMEIETASAFLNQMIETTREAPENLGTALKTIIARFQELKTSEEELSDGVDANKVERALKSAGVALRDASGQFRDFDDVILELSSKWDGLDRNTQRYIATIAAGSRQQSRFIALVSDYEGLLRNVNYAYDSLGSADAQMAVFQEGLAASTNRLQAAWEGLYTSWSESATVISKLIDGMADLISSLADLGAGTSGVIAGIALLTTTILTNAAANAIELKSSLAKVSTLDALKKAYQSLIVEQVKSLGLTLAAVAPYVAIGAAISALIFLYIKVKNSQNDYIKSLEKEATLARQEAAQAKDRASNIDVLLTELNNAKNSEEDLLTVREKIIDQFGEEIPAVNDLGLSYENLVQILKEYQTTQEGLAAKKYIDNALLQDTIDQIPKTLEERIDFADLSREMGGHFADFRIGNFSIFTSYELDGKSYTSYADYVRAIKEKAGLSDFTLDDSVKGVINKALLDTDALRNETELSKDIINHWLDSLEPAQLKILYNDDGELNAELAEELSKANDAVNNFYNQLKTDQERVGFADLLSGSFDGLSFEMANQLITELQNVSPTIAGALQEIVAQYASDLRDAFSLAIQNGDLAAYEQDAIESHLLPGAQRAFIDTFNSLANDPEAQEAYKQAVFKIFSQGLSPEEMTPGFIESLASLETAMEQYTSLLNGWGQGVGENAEKAEALRKSIGDLNAAYLEGMDVINDYYSIMDSFSAAMEGGLSDADYDAKIRDMAAAMEELGIATEEEALKQLYAATIRDANGKLILQQNDWIREATDLMYTEGEAAVESKKAEILAYAASIDALGDRLIAIGEEMQAQEASGHANSAATNALLANAAKEINAFQDLQTASTNAYHATEGGKGNIMGEQARYVQKLADEIKAGGLTGADIIARGKALKQQAANLRSMAAALSITRKNLDKAGKSAGSAAKGTDKLKDALKDLKEQLDEAKKSAEAYMDAVIDKLEGERDAIEDAIEAEQDKLEKERDLLKIQLEAWRDYIQERNDQAQNELQLQADAADMYFNQEIAAIQAKIDALDDEAEAEDRILKLQKARDEYNKAQNSRTRLVLTKGAGWLFKTDQNEIANAQKTLRDVQREIQKAEYQDQVNQLQDQAAAWQEIADKIGESAAEAEKLAAALEQFRGAVESGDAYGDVNAFSQAVDNQQHLNDETTRLLEEAERWIEQAGWEYQDYLDDQARQGFLQEFQDGVVGEAQLQENVTQYLENLLTNQAFVEAQQAILDKIQKVIDFYNEQKALLGLTDAELKAAEEMRDAIEKSYDPTAENLGLGEDSKYFNANLLGLIEQIKKLAEQQAALEAQQKAAGAAGGGSGGGGSGGGGGISPSGGTSYLSGGGSNYKAPLAGNAILSGNTVLDSLRNTGWTYNNAIARESLNAIRDSYAGNATVYSPAGLSSTDKSTNININSMMVSANNVDDFVNSLKRKGYVTY